MMSFFGKEKLACWLSTRRTFGKCFYPTRGKKGPRNCPRQFTRVHGWGVEKPKKKTLARSNTKTAGYSCKNKTNQRKKCFCFRKDIRHQYYIAQSLNDFITIILLPQILMFMA